ncbi:MAG: ATP-binding protein [Clostridia bacterium]|nr:ATP-binding protein [Clostridia bacterium]
MLFEIENFLMLDDALAKMCAAFREEAIPENAVFDCKLVARELLSNALRYGGGRARFTFERSGEEIHIRVKSATDFVPPKVSVCSDVTAERGRGLYLVDAVSDERAYSKEEGICVIVKIEE